MHYSKGLILLIILFVFTKQNLAQHDPVIQSYLDSSTKYIYLKRVDKIFQFNQKADKISRKSAKVSFEQHYSIQYNYIWVFNYIKRNDLKLKHSKIIYEILQKEDRNNERKHLLYYLNISGLAHLYSDMGEVDSATYYFKQANKAANEIDGNLFRASSHNNYGLFLSKYDSWDAAKLQFDSALNLIQFQTIQDSTLYASIRDNLSDYYLNLKDTSKAIELIESNIAFLPRNSHTIETKLDRWGIKLLQLYLNQNQLSEALVFSEDLRNLINSSEGRWYYEYMDQFLDLQIGLAIQLDSFIMISSVEAEQYHFRKQYLAFVKQNYSEITTVLSNYISSTISQELERTAEELAETKRASERKFFILSGSLLLAFLFSLLIAVNFKRKMKIKNKDALLKTKQLEIETLQKEKLALELEDQTKDFSKVLMQASIQDQWNGEMIENLKRIIKEEPEELKTHLSSLIRALNQRSTIGSKIKNERENIDTVNATFYRKIEQRFPELTKSEKETCALIRMNLDSKEIAAIRNINPSSVRKLRQRIRSKLGLSIDHDLYQFVQAI